tara:strand:+ start:17370 stop:18092 length:723 start_codon:yes stop_codon:yes gene_type:complete
MLTTEMTDQDQQAKGDKTATGAMSVVVVDYGSGNLRSVAKAVEHAANDGNVKGTIKVSQDPADIRAADRLVLPGQGAFADCRNGLAAVPGLLDALEEHVTVHQRPLFGICVGMQLFADEGHEHGVHPGFGWIGGTVDAITDQIGTLPPGLKIPHMGWNELTLDMPDHPVLAGVHNGDHVYFAHSYAMRVTDPAHRLAHAAYGAKLTAMVGRDHIVGTQFHPEKSQAVGLRLLQNFLGWAP